jgi:hypothetical protein
MKKGVIIGIGIVLVILIGLRYLPEETSVQETIVQNETLANINLIKEYNIDQTFNGIDDYLEISDFNELNNLGKGSISVWFKVEDIPDKNGIRPIFYYGAKDPCQNMPDASNQGFIIEVGHDPMHPNSKNLYYTFFSKGCDYPSFCYDSNNPIEEGKWYNFIAVVGEDYNTGYLNGEEMTDRRYNFGNRRDSEFFEDAVKPEVIWIGKGYWNAQPVFFKGEIGEIQIYDQPLTKEKVKEIYEAGID